VFFGIPNYCRLLASSLVCCCKHVNKFFQPKRLLEKMVLPRRSSQTGSTTTRSNNPNGQMVQTTFRIPLALQSVFLMGNRGVEMNCPPPDASAMKTFNTTLRWGRRMVQRSKSNDSQLTASTVDSNVSNDVPKEAKVRVKKTKSKVSMCVSSLLNQAVYSNNLHSFTFIV
jgi:hypothetical protein